MDPLQMMQRRDGLMTRRIEGDQTLRVPARKQPRKALKKAEERYRRIFEDSKDMVYITSANGKHAEVNQAGVDITWLWKQGRDDASLCKGYFSLPRGPKEIDECSHKRGVC